MEPSNQPQRSKRDLELEVYECLTKLATSGMLGFKPECVRVQKGKAYFSTARRANIIVDVSVELVLEGYSQPFIIWVWECKDYSRRVEVADIEEFDAKLQQIGANNTKGTIITRAGFQKAAIEYAKERRIGLARFIDPSQIVHDRIHSPASDREAAAVAALMTSALEPSFQDEGIACLSLNGEVRKGGLLQDFVAAEFEFISDNKPETLCACCNKRPAGIAWKAKFYLVPVDMFGESALDFRYMVPPGGPGEREATWIPFWRRFHLCRICSALMQLASEDQFNVGCVLPFLILIVSIAWAFNAKSWHPLLYGIAATAALWLCYFPFGLIMRLIMRARFSLKRPLPYSRAGLLYVIVESTMTIPLDMSLRYIAFTLHKL